MKYKRLNINGRWFRDYDGNIVSEEMLCYISCNENKECSVGFFDGMPEEFSDVFDKYNCTGVGIERRMLEMPINLDAIKYPDKIKSFNLSVLNSSNVVCSDRKSYFKNLVSLSINGNKPTNFPNLLDVKTIEYLMAEREVAYLGKWVDLSTVKHLYINDFQEEDLLSLKHFKSLEMLQLYNRPKMRSLDGLENLPNLRILDIAHPTKLADVSAIMRTKNLRNIQFRKFKKVQNWDFLADKKDIEALALDTAESTEFVKKLPNLKYFFCEKALDKNSKPVYYVPETMTDITPRSAFKDGWPHTKAFQYQPT